MLELLICGMPELWELNRRGTRITDDGLAHLKNLPKLRGLLVGCTKITDAGLDQIGAGCHNWRGLTPTGQP